jgi:hypothetical protein
MKMDLGSSLYAGSHSDNIGKHQPIGLSNRYGRTRQSQDGDKV